MLRFFSTRHAPLFAVLMVTALLMSFFGPSPTISMASSSSSDCGCVGSYVDPSVKTGVSPVQPSTSSDTYALAVFAGGLTVTEKSRGAQVLGLQLPGDFQAGFDPSGNRLLVWGVDSNQQDFAQLYDLTSNSPQTPVWHIESITGGLVVGFSGHGKYLLTLAQSDPTYVTAWVVNTSTGGVAFRDQLPAGSGHVFSPDQDRFLITTANGSVSHVALYDLAAGRYSWQGDTAAGSLAAFFSPHGAYLGVATITYGSRVDLTVLAAASAGSGYNPSLLSTSFTAAGTPGQGKDKYGYAGWGFSPDKTDSTFVYTATYGSNGATLTMVNLARNLQPATFAYPNIVSGFWQFSPCGDVLAIAVQPSSSNNLSLELHETDYSSTGTAAVVQRQYTSLNVSLSATAAWQVATVDGTDDNLIRNTGCQGAPSNGTGNGSPSGPGTPGSGSGSGTPGGGTVPGGVHVSPYPTISSFSVNQSVVVAGGSVTGTIALDSGSGNSVSLTSSDPTALPVPSSVWASYPGSGAFTAHIGSVTHDEIVTVTATLGTSTKSVSVAIKAACPTTPAAMSTIADASAMAIPVGNGLGPNPVPSSPRISGLTVDPLILMGGNAATGSVVLSESATHDETISLASSSTGAVQVPASVTIPRGQTAATFPVTTQGVSTDTFITIRASMSMSIRAARIVLLPALQVTGVTFDPASVPGGTASQGTVTLNTPVITCDSPVVQLTSGNTSLATVPANVSMPQGAQTATFSVSTQAVSTDTMVAIDATLGSSAATGSLTLTAANLELSNDNFANAATLGIPGMVSGDTSTATIETGEQVLSGTCYVLQQHHLENSVWFKLTPAQSGTLTVSTANPGTNFDTVLALYSDPGTTNVGDLSTPIGCDNNGDGNPAVDHTGPGGPMTPEWSSIMHVTVQAGQTYYLQLGGVGGAPYGKYVLTTTMN